MRAKFKQSYGKFTEVYSFKLEVIRVLFQERGSGSSWVYALTECNVVRSKSVNVKI